MISRFCVLWVKVYFVRFSFLLSYFEIVGWEAVGSSGTGKMSCWTGKTWNVNSAISRDEDSLSFRLLIISEN